VISPIRLGPNQFPRFYRGGPRIDALRGRPETPDHRPEDWIASTTTALGEAPNGLTTLPDGRVLRDAIEADAEAFLGAAHVARYGPDPALLVKLLDAGERLPVHVHPGRAFSARHLGLPYGKTEAWLIVDADPGATVHVGFREPVDAATVEAWVGAQDAEAMLDALQRIEITAGDALLVPAGTPHAIGEGVLILELQEPTDLSVLLEWKRFGVNDGSEHLNLGWETALHAVDLDAAPPDQTAGLPADAEPYFRARHLRPLGGDVEFEPSFAILVALRGNGTLHSERADSLPLTRGDTVLVPFAAGRTALSGAVELIRCLPPAPDAPEARW
jgi:mannose-6-phosphate isomerase